MKRTTMHATLLATALVLPLGLAGVTEGHAEISYTKQQLRICGTDSTASYGIIVSQMNGISLTNVNPIVQTPSEPIPVGGAVAQSSAIGSADTGDTSQWVDCRLFIHLRNEFPAIYGNRNRINFLNPVSKTYNTLYAAGVVNLSDARAKKDVADLDAGLASLTRLRPVSFRWIPSPVSDEAEEETTQSYGSGAGDLQYGFIAQEVENVLPDMVTTDTDGNKGINYTALIPVLVKSVQELQGEVAAQAAVIESLGSQLARQSGAEIPKDRIVSCTPNPTKGDVTVSYTLLPETTEARILVTNLIGTAVASETCGVTGTSVSFNLGGAAPGVYLATLVCDGEVRDSRQIVVSR